VSRGCGFADFEQGLVPDQRTKYGIGSITKSMTTAPDSETTVVTGHDKMLQLIGLPDS